MTTNDGEGHAFFTYTTCLVWRILARVQEHGSATAPSLNELRERWDTLQANWRARQRADRMRLEFVPLFDGDTLIGQMTIERPFNARDNLPFVERIHPDDCKPEFPPENMDAQVMSQQRVLRVQRFTLRDGRYRLEHIE